MTDSERSDILETLGAHRGFLLQTTRDLTDEQAALTPTVSALSLGGLIKHVSETERQWVDFILEGTRTLTGPTPPTEWGPAQWQARADGFRMLPGETLVGLLADYQRVAERTDRVVRELPDLDLAHPLPQAPWFPADTTRSARRVLLHIVAETAQHAGHADIIRESIDGATTM